MIGFRPVVGPAAVFVLKVEAVAFICIGKNRIGLADEGKCVVGIVGVIHIGVIDLRFYAIGFFDLIRCGVERNIKDLIIVVEHPSGC